MGSSSMACSLEGEAVGVGYVKGKLLLVDGELLARLLFLVPVM